MMGISHIMVVLERWQRLHAPIPVEQTALAQVGGAAL